MSSSSRRPLLTFFSQQAESDVQRKRDLQSLQCQPSRVKWVSKQEGQVRIRGEGSRTSSDDEVVVRVRLGVRLGDGSHSGS